MIREGNYFTRNILHGHFNQAVHDSFDIGCLAPDSELVIGRSTSLKNGVDMPDLLRERKSSITSSTKLERGVRTHIPIDLFAIVDASGFDE